MQEAGSRRRGMHFSTTNCLYLSVRFAYRAISRQTCLGCVVASVERDQAAWFRCQLGRQLPEFHL